MIFSAILASTFYSSVITTYSAIILTKKESSIFKFYVDKKTSMVKIYLIGVLSINLLTLLVFIILGLTYVHFVDSYINGLLFYVLVSISLPSILLIYLFITGSKINMHRVGNIGFYILITTVFLPFLIEQSI